MDNVTKLIPIIKTISTTQPPGKKMLQKLVYLIERKGLNLGFNYSIHYYGPYSSGLDYAIHGLEMQGAIQIIPDGMTQRIHTTDIAEMLLTENTEQIFDENQMNLIESVINKFSSLTAKDLEVITTTDFVTKNSKVYNEEDIRVGVKKIKGEKFSDEQIRWAILQLKDMGIFQN